MEENALERGIGQIHNRVAADRGKNYSTMVKMLSIMLEKGLVKRDETVRPQVFRPAATQRRTQQRMLKDLVQKAYAGSVGSLVLQALSSRASSPEELAQIRRLLNEREGGPRHGRYAPVQNSASSKPWWPPPLQTVSTSP
jgi:BlaI family penicillinase repressor